MGKPVNSSVESVVRLFTRLFLLFHPVVRFSRRRVLSFTSKTDCRELWRTVFFEVSWSCRIPGETLKRKCRLKNCKKSNSEEVQRPLA